MQVSDGISEIPADRRAAVKARWLDLGGLLIMGFTTTLFLWQAVTYRGLIAFLAELQFRWIGNYYPTQTCLVVIALSLMPGLMLLRAAERRRSAIEPRSAGLYHRLTMRVLFTLAAASMIAAGCALMWIVRLPSEAGQARVIHADLPLEGQIDDGPALLICRVDYFRTASLDEDVWLARRSPTFAPVTVAFGEATRFFIQLDRGLHVASPLAGSASNAQHNETLKGILMRQALPGEVLSLYRYAGLNVAEPYYVLYPDRASLLWPYLSAAAQLALFSLILAAGGFALLTWQRADARREPHDYGIRS